ncbi:haloacid dehalogenase type II [Halarchaeum nitratireducens]|uniref:Haloacid dehalogenase n=1 Tax=Halarchaeum nitratireducens TaxID=489913 RepID=A0A830GDF7_9EURY|nr:MULTISPECIES: haloacid dehalogenase type II [Halarchaeum]MBP2250842.1 2-haloacid dehalogenase [Halarchaeum solikamskense]GGN19345.1 haloacid dehalogenase [Halarchaeum nitratireducens]
MADEALCFDMYGTLCDVSSVADAIERELDIPGGLAADVDALWRSKQIEYAYHRGAMDRYEPFDVVTRDALGYALDYYGLDVAATDALLSAYDDLDPYPDVLDALDRLTDERDAVVFSNGTPAMLDRLAANAGIDARVDGLVSADDAGALKPDPAVYEHVASELDRPLPACRLVSSNGWDVAGASAAGMATAWVNRDNDPAERVGGDADVVVEDLVALADVL